MMGPKSCRNLDTINRKLEKNSSDLKRMYDLKKDIGAGSYIRESEYRTPSQNSLYPSEEMQRRTQIEPPNLSHLYGVHPLRLPSSQAQKTQNEQKFLSRDSGATPKETSDSSTTLTPNEDYDYANNGENLFIPNNNGTDLLDVIEEEISRISRASSPSSKYSADGITFEDYYATDIEEDENEKGTSTSGWYPTMTELETYRQGPNGRVPNIPVLGPDEVGGDSPEEWENWEDSNEDVVYPEESADGNGSDPEGSDEPDSEDDDIEDESVSESESESGSESGYEEDSEDDEQSSSGSGSGSRPGSISGSGSASGSGSDPSPFSDPPIRDVGAHHRVSISTVDLTSIEESQTAVLERVDHHTEPCESQSREKKCHSSRLMRAFERHAQSRRARKEAKAEEKRVKAEIKERDRIFKKRMKKTQVYMNEMRKQCEREGREYRFPLDQELLPL